MEINSPLDGDFSKLMNIVDEGIEGWEVACTGDVNSYKKTILG